MTEREYAVLPVDRNAVTGIEKTTFKEAVQFWSNMEEPGWKLVRVANYPCGTDEHGTTLYPIFAILKVN